VKRAALLLALAWAFASPSSAEDRFVAPLPDPGDVEVRKDIPYGADGASVPKFDLYRPATRPVRLPVVIFVNGIGADWIRGHVQYTSWARAVTARGLAGITMDSREASVDEDVRALITHLTGNAAGLGVDPSRIALWSCSSNVTRGLPLAQSLGASVRAAVVYYGRAEGPASRRDLPVLFVRAGRDSPSLNKGLEALVTQALADNAPAEMMNVASGVHGFDVRDDTEAARHAIARTLDFLTATLTGPFHDAVIEGALLAAAASAAYREDWPAAVSAYEALTRATPEDSLLWQRLGEARRAAGSDPAAALAALEKSLALGSPNHGIVSFAIATLQTESDNLDAAFAALRGMKAQLRFFAARLRTEPVFEKLRADPRFAELMKNVPPPP